MQIDQSVTPETPRPGLLEMIENRQQEILSHLPGYVKVTGLLALLGFAITSLVQWVTDTMPEDYLGLITISSPTLASLITLFLSLFSILIMWVFVIWSLTFIPFVAYHAHRSSRKFNVAGTRVFKWIQLYASTFFPMAIFAVIWNSFAVEGSIVVARIDSFNEVAAVAVGTVVVSFILWLVNRVLPSQWIALRLSIMSFMLYAALFLSYGWGYGLVSYYMLFGVLVYLVLFGSSHLEAIGREVVTYDLDSQVAQGLREILTQYQKTKAVEEEMVKREYISEIQKKEYQQILRMAEGETDASLRAQLADIYRERADLNRRVNEARIGLFRRKLDAISELYEILSSELSRKADEEIPRQIEKIRDNVQDFSPEELRECLNRLMVQINSSFAGLPESLEDLRTEVRQLTDDVEQYTRFLLSGSEDAESSPESSAGDDHQSLGDPQEE